ncbi:MAG TPA: signal recognition particle protein [Bacillota bacterium]|nr:signal recognition particle protein [Bacillota bacterium]
MFGGLAERLQGIFRDLRGRGRLGVAEVDAALREVRLALLEADVNFRVARDFIDRVRSRAVGAEVMESLTPGQQVIKIVHEVMIELLGSTPAGLDLGQDLPAVILLVGLHGSGKTTTAVRLAVHLKDKGRRPLLVGADVYRPAAGEQLTVLAGRAGLPVRVALPGSDPVAATRKHCGEAPALGCDTVIIDTAGRLHVDGELMAEMERLSREFRPRETLLVVDAMTGQDAVNVARSFQERVAIDGFVLTKLDGDARGGAALSLRAVSGRPIKFAGVGEGLRDLDVFHPERMASRVLGMGDVLALIERAQATVDEQAVHDLERKLRADAFTLEDFLLQLRQVKKLGPLEDILKLLPGFPGRQLAKGGVDQRDLAKAEAIISSMTAHERRQPEILDASRRRRVARGSGTQVQEVNRLLRQYEEARKMFRQLARWQRGAGRGSPAGWPPRR